MPAPAMPAALASGSIDAATLIHAQAFKAMQTGEFVPIVQTAGDLTKKFGVRMVSAVLAGYGDKLDAHADDYKEFLRVLKASTDYALAHQDEVFPAVGQETKTDPEFFKAWFTRFSEFPVVLTKDDLKGKKLGVYSLGSAGITLIRIALADVHGFNVNTRGGDVEFLEMPAPSPDA
jgi:NitT/TauT family transport system substrate-binding protein